MKEGGSRRIHVVTKLLHRHILVSEIFGPTIQGEGALIGKPTIFVRTGGCDYRCSWCDTLYAVLPEHRDEWTPMEAGEILDEVLRLSHGQPILVTLSGGNPALQPLEPLLDEGHARGLTFAMETQGSVPRPWFARLDYLTLSPKPPSSGMKTDWEKLAACVACAGSRTQTVLKIVIFDEADYQYAKEVAGRFPGLAVYLQPGNHTPPHVAPAPDVPALLDRLRWLAECVAADGWNDATVLPQLHTLMWGNKRGV
jgi:7-carboxy-7-deazaguanine synthase